MSVERSSSEWTGSSRTCSPPDGTTFGGGAATLGSVQPASTLLFFVGYLLALPIALRMPLVVEQQHRLAMTGHQVGVAIATIGWLTRGALVVAVIHIAWMIGVRLWFSTNTGSGGS